MISIPNYPPPGRPPSLFDGHIARLDQLAARIGNGAATTDELRDVMAVIRAMAESLARMEINLRG